MEYLIISAIVSVAGHLNSKSNRTHFLNRTQMSKKVIVPIYGLMWPVVAVNWAFKAGKKALSR